MINLVSNLKPLLSPPIYSPLLPEFIYNNYLPPTPPIMAPLAIIEKKDNDDDDKKKIEIHGLVNINPIYTPLINNYPDLNSDNQIHKRFTLYFWYRLQSSWIYKYKKLYKYIKGSNGDYRITSDPTVTSRTELEIELIADFILNEIYRKSDLAKSLEKFRLQMNINWWDLKYYTYTIKKFIYYQIKKKLVTQYV